MKALVAWICLAAASVSAAALTSEEEKALAAQAGDYLSAASKGDAEKFLRMTHPALHGLFGGKEPFEEATRAALKALAGKQSVTGVAVGRPTAPLVVGKEELCFVPMEVSTKVGNLSTRTNSYYIAVRELGGSGWRFIDAAGLRKRPEVLWQLFPGLPKDVVLPRNEVTVNPVK